MEDLEVQQLADIMSYERRMDEHMTGLEAEAYKQKLLTEMAYERKMFKALLTNISRQIIENWCLIRYAKISKSYQNTVSHWESELNTHIGNAASNKIKGNDSYASRVKAIQEVWMKEKEYGTDSNVIDLTIRGKFMKENIPTNTPLYNQVLTDCVNASNSLIDIIAKADPNIISQYVMSI